MNWWEAFVHYSEIALQQPYTDTQLFMDEIIRLAQDNNEPASTISMLEMTKRIAGR